MSNVEQKTERPRISCFSNILEKPENLEKTGLFSPERMAEIKSFISDDKFGPVELKSGKVIPGWICHKETGEMWAEDHFWKGSGKVYALTRTLEKFLTDSEIELINKFANEAYSAARDKEMFERAQKVKPEEWAGRVFWNDEYFLSVDDFEEEFIGRFNDYDFTNKDLLTIEDNKYDKSFDKEVLIKKYLPDYIWAVDDEKPVVNLDLDNILEDIASDAYEDFDAGDLDGQDELRLALEKFNKVNESFKSWGVTHTTAIILK